MSKQQECCSPLVSAPLISAPLTEGEAASYAPLFKALGDPVRLRLFSLIASHEGGEACVCDLTGAFELSGPTISHHLKALKRAGLVDSERRGTWVYYRVHHDALERIGALAAVPTGSSRPDPGPRC